MPATETSDNFTLVGDFPDVQRRFVEEGWTDGLPIVPPTAEAVGELVAIAAKYGVSELGPIPPLGIMAPIEQVGSLPAPPMIRRPPAAGWRLPAASVRLPTPSRAVSDRDGAEWSDAGRRKSRGCRPLRHDRPAG